MTQPAKPCTPTPLDWGDAKFETAEGSAKLQFKGDEAARAALYHNAIAPATLVHDASQRVVDPLNREGLGKALSNTAHKYVMATFERIKPQDPLEEMLVAQSLLTHSRMMYLSRIMLEHAEIEVIQRISEAADRAANTYRRQMLALREYRRPTKTVHFIRQNNVAGQQIVSNSFSESENATNEQGLQRTDNQEVQHHQQATPALSTDEGRIDPLAGISRTRETVGAKHRAEDGGGKGSLPDERAEAR